MNGRRSLSTLRSSFGFAASLVAAGALLLACGGADSSSADKTGDEADALSSAGTSDLDIRSPVNDSKVPSPAWMRAHMTTCNGSKPTSFGYSIDDSPTIIPGVTLADIDTTVALSAGTHSVHYKAWSSGGLCMGSSSFTVAGGTTSAPDAGVDSGAPDSGAPDSGSSGSGYDGSKTIPEPPASASLYSDIDDGTQWSAKTGAASQCPDGVASSTCDPVNANYDTTVEHVKDPGSEPSGGNGEAGEFSLYDGPANATCIWGHSIATLKSARSFIWDFQIYVDASDYQNSELDFYQILNGQRFMMGTQCDRANDSWDTWNENTQHWVKNTEIHCQELLTVGAWHHVVMYLSTDSDSSTYTYNTIRVDDVDYVLNQTQPGKPSTWPNGLVGVQVQLDADKDGKGVNEYIDGMKTYAW